MKPSRRQIIIMVGFAAAIVLIVVLALMGRKDNTYTIVVDPLDSVLTLDGAVIKPGQVTLTKGKHTLKATHKFFADAVKEVDTTDLARGQTIYVVPAPNSPEALQWLTDHPDTTGQREATAGAAATERAAFIDATFPIIQKLPYKSLDFTIDYSIDPANKLSLTITLKPYAKPDNPEGRTRQLKQFKAEALEFLQTNGLKPGDVPLTYVPAEATDL